MEHCFCIECKRGNDHFCYFEKIAGVCACRVCEYGTVGVQHVHVELLYRGKLVEDVAIRNGWLDEKLAIMKEFIAQRCEPTDSDGYWSEKGEFCNGEYQIRTLGCNFSNCEMDVKTYHS